jgi:acyl-[acyl-carrier-protein]-phospholipid O-acyltransferase/long-chain-fatty-acid--[acyl-carrier-protein] ligase
MRSNSNSIWSVAGLLPYVTVVFLNAFTDLGHKIIIQNTVFKIYDGQTQIMLTAIVNGLILLPFILLFTPSGFLSDRFAKNKVMRLSAWAAVAVTLGITYAYTIGAFEFAFFLTFVLAAQSAIYSPAKYGYIKELVGKRFLTLGNGIVQAVTMVAILGGIVVYSLFFEGLLFEQTYSDSADILRHIAPVGWVLVLGSLLELLLAYRIPDTKVRSDIVFDIKKYYTGAYLRKNLAILFENSTILYSIIGLSLFWSVSQVVLASFPAHAKDALGMSNTVLVQGMMALAGIGIVIGSIVSGRASKNYIETGTIPLGALGISVSLLLLVVLEDPLFHAFNFFAFGFFAGIFVVPLNALIQFSSKEHELGLVLAGNNFVQNVGMLSFLGLTVLFAIAGMGSIGLFYLMLAVALLGSAYVLRHLPQSLVIFLLSSLIARRVKLEVIGFDNIPQSGGVLLLGNHISWLDWAIVQMAMPRRVRFVMDRQIYEKWYLRLFLDFFHVVPVSPKSVKEAAREVKALLNRGEVVCIFPEGAISRNAQLGEFRRGFELMAKDANACILPFYLRGMWGSRLSRSSARFKEARKSGKREVIVAFGKPMAIESRATAVKQKVFELSYGAWAEHAKGLATLGEAWVETACRLRGKFCMADSAGEKLSYLRALMHTILLSASIKRHKEQNIAVLMPMSSAGAMATMAVLMAGKTVVNLNYTAPFGRLKSAMQKAEIKTLYSTRALMERLDTKGCDVKVLLQGCELVCLEELTASVPRVKGVLTLLAVRLLPAFILKPLYLKKVPNEEVATILFASGLKEEPKGVMLTHKNLMANIKQLSELFNMRHEDVVLASLPLYNPFGLTVTTLLPLIEGIPIVCHDDPRDVAGIGRAAEKHRATLLLGSSAFFRLCVKNKSVHPEIFMSLRIAIAGEMLPPELKEAFRMKFHKELLEGYGVSECAPVVSVNLPNVLDAKGFGLQVGQKEGSVGMPLPGTAFKIVDPQSLRALGCDEEGLILIGGAQVMKGYLKEAQKSAEAIKQIEGIRWYKTHDRGHLDRDGYLYISKRRIS